MKTTSFLTAIFVVLSLLASNTCFAAKEGEANDQNYAYDTQMVDGRISTHTIFKVTNQNTLTPYLKHEFSYLADGKVSCKKTLYWIADAQEWKEVAIYNYTYFDNTCNIELSVWNARKNTMVKNRRYIYSTDSDNNLTMSINFDWNAKDDNWVVDGEMLEATPIA